MIWGTHGYNILMKVFNERTHSAIEVMIFLDFALSPCNSTSRTVGCGTPKRDGSSSSSSMYSPHQFFSASLTGMGGEIGLLLLPSWTEDCPDKARQ